MCTYTQSSNMEALFSIIVHMKYVYKMQQKHIRITNNHNQFLIPLSSIQF